MSITDDPVLRTYKVGLPEYPVLGEQICYDIGGFFAPVSIRDQIIRSCSVIERAWHYGLISPTRPLLIIGGGHAGVVAAIQAVECGVETTLIDRNDVLSRLARSGRFVSMLQYDWPAAHWRKKTFPWDDSDSIPVVIEDGPVRVSVATLRNEFSVARADFADRFHLHPYTVCSDPIVEADPAGGYPTLKMSFDKVDFDGTVVRSVTPSVTEFGMALSCTGLGAEKVYLPDPHPFRSVEFWALDTFNRVDKGSVIICGSGDGGLQDFL